ncbi:MAG: hypothetical protein ACOX83_10760 [Candidatus Spyradocola sp.]|jgi:hypothetical protein
MTRRIGDSIGVDVYLMPILRRSNLNPTRTSQEIADVVTHQMSDEDYAHMLALLNRKRRLARGIVFNDNPHDPQKE